MRGQILDFSIDFRRRPYNTLMLLFRVSIIIWIQDKTEYQLLRMKASEKRQFKFINWLCFDELL